MHSLRTYLGLPTVVVVVDEPVDKDDDQDGKLEDQGSAQAQVQLPLKSTSPAVDSKLECIINVFVPTFLSFAHGLLRIL